jgi:nicotinamide mononucleotide (NMN) deamidase PncC
MTPTSWGIGTTGVAGPDSQDGKPVGMVFIGIASSRGGKRFGPFHFPGSPERVREATIIEALNLLRQEVVKARQGVSLRI